MMYFKSEYTGQVYALTFIPMGEGWKLSTREEYVQWMTEHGLADAIRG